jgi:hypothetical protein
MLWVEGRITTMERLCIKSFLDFGHNIEVYSYSNPTLPPGAILKDAREILAEDEVFTYNDKGLAKGPYPPQVRKISLGGYGAFANLFRYALLSERHGIWADTDMVCLKQWDFEPCELVVGRQSDAAINNAVLQFPMDSLLPIQLFERARQLGKDVYHAQTGPILLTEMLSGDTGDSLREFYPIHWTDIEKFVIPEIPIPNSHGIHFWNTWWKHKNLDKDGLYHPDCIYEKLKRKHLKQ